MSTETTDDDPFVTIRQRTGNYIINKPNKTTTEVEVKIPAYDFDHQFSFDEGFPNMRGEPWLHALYEITDDYWSRNIGDGNAQEELVEILNEHDVKIDEEWRAYRRDQIDEEIEKLKEERESL